MQKKALFDLIEQFCISGTPSSILPYGSGHINDTYRVEMVQAHPGYILQRINHHVFANVPALMDNIVRVTSHIRKKLLQDPNSSPDEEGLTLIDAHNGTHFVQDDNGDYWRLYLFLANTEFFDVVTDPQVAYLGGCAFGQFSNLLADLPGGPLHVTIPNFNNIVSCADKLEQALDADVCRRAQEVKSELDFVRELIDPMSEVIRQGHSGDLPTRVTHNDTKFNNVLLSKDHSRACVIDLDTVMPGYVQYDFSDTVRTATNTAAEDEADLSLVSMDIGLFEGYARGFVGQLHESLTELEVSHLSHSAELLPFTIGVRFLTDYLEGDTYFKIHKDKHNLIRARAQFQLAKSVRAQRQAMTDIIDQIMQHARGLS